VAVVIGIIANIVTFIITYTATNIGSHK